MSVKIAYHTPCEKLIHIDKAENGLRCNCICLACDEPLEARQGGKRDWHFKHHINVNCSGSQETALHELAKQILLGNTHVEVPKYGRISYSEAVAEKKLDQIRPDVSAVYNGQPIYFEVFVSNAVDEGKKKFFKLGKHRSIEIDLSNSITSTFQEIEDLVINVIDNKTVFYWEDEAVILPGELNEPPKSIKLNTDTDNSLGWLSAILALLAIFGIYKYSKKQNRKRRK